MAETGMSTESQLKYQEENDDLSLQHSEYFSQFEDVVRNTFSINEEEITRYRTVQTLPLSDDDKQARMFRKKRGVDPVVQIYSEEELDEMDEETKYKLVTKGALSFNDTPEAARESAILEDRKRKQEKGGKKKSERYRKERGDKIGKFVFPPRSVLVSKIVKHHQNILPPSNVDIEQYRDISFEGNVGYDEN